AESAPATSMRAGRSTDVGRTYRSRARRSPTMNASHHVFLAFDLARERAAEADRYRLAAKARAAAAGLLPQVNPVRRAVARRAVAVARAGHAAARRPAVRPH